ncbi:aminotransferase class I/II-fold pyridoxal phosphate-dependent enzyme [Cellulomonas soli]
MIVGQGFADLLDGLGRALRDRGARRVAVEAYGHQRHRRLLVEAGLELVPLPVDAEGAVVARLHDLDVDAVLLTPAHQFPTGVALSAQRRRAVVEWAFARRGLVIEDDYDGEFRFDRRSVGALQALAPDRVVYAGTASKALAPAVGLAWAAVPAWLLPDVLAQRELGVRPSGLHQRTLAAFVDGHEYDRAVRRRRTQFRQRRSQLAELVARRVPTAALWGLPAGLQCLVTVADVAAEQRAVAEAARRGVRLEGLGSFVCGGDAWPDHPREPGAGVVVGYGAPPPAQTRQALEHVVEALAAAVPREP